LVNELDFDLPAQGMPRDPFGSAIVTNVGMFGIDTAFAPLLPMARCPMLILVPEVRRRPFVDRPCARWRSGRRRERASARRIAR